MCTVTYLPLTPNLPSFRNLEGFILTSNRDEKVARPAAKTPEIHTIKNKKIIFPQDPKGKGSWIAMGENGSTVCLLNGGFKSHIPQSTYKHSRGLVVIDFFSFDTISQFYSNYAFEGIEPFTLIVVQDGKLFEIRWDGDKAFKKELDATKAHIWSSVTLYSPEIIQKRKQWFDKWNKNIPLKKPLSSSERGWGEAIIDFHRFGGDGDSQNDVSMNRENILKTVSITSVEVNENFMNMTYIDLVNQTENKIDFSFSHLVG